MIKIQQIFISLMLLLIVTNSKAQNFQQIATDSLFNSPQFICIFSIPKQDTNFYYSLAQHSFNSEQPFISYQEEE